MKKINWKEIGGITVFAIGANAPFFLHIFGVL